MGHRPTWPLTLSSAGCNSNDISPPAYLSGGLPQAIRFVMCADITGKTGGTNCDSNKGGGRSYRFLLNETLDGNVVGSGLISDCINESGGTSLTSTTSIIPVGVLNSPRLNLHIVAYPQLSCAGTSTIYYFDSGLINGATDTSIFSTGGYTEVFLEMAPLAPNLTGYTVDTPNYTQNTPIATNSPSNTGGMATSWGISPTLPSGLAFNTSTGVITGTPTVSSSASLYTVTATNVTGSDTYDLTIAVLPPPPIVSGYPDPNNFIVGLAISTMNPTMSGGAATSFSISPALPAGLSLNTATGAISGTPSAPSSNALYTVTATNAGGNGQQSNIDIMVASPASLSISDGATYDFGQQVYGSFSEHTFTVTNSGGVNATGMSGTAPSSPYSFKGGTYPGTGATCGTSLSSGSNCTIIVTYNPVGAGPYNDSFGISYNDGVTGQNATRNITGTGIAPASLTISDGATYDYGTIAIGASVDKTFTITNSGSTTATSLSGSGLAAPYTFKGGTYPGTGGSCGTTLAAAANCTVVVTYTPSAVTVSNDALDMSYHDGANPGQTSSRNITGTGANPAVLAVTATGFGSVLTNTNSTSTSVTINNNGGVTATSMAHSSFTGGSEFNYVGGSYPGTGGTCGTSLGAGGSCTIQLTFTPTQVISYSRTVNISYHTGVSSTSAGGNLTGTGLRPFFGTGADGALTISAASTDYVSATPGAGGNASALGGVVSTSGNTITLTGTYTTADFKIGDEVMWYVNQAGASSTSCGGEQGRYGFKTVTARTSTTITIDSALPFIPSNTELSQASNSTTFCSMQIIKVSNLTNLTINAASDATVAAYDKTMGTGGIIAIRVSGTLTLNGNIDMVGKGFASGAGTGSSGAKGDSEQGDGANANGVDGTRNSMGAGNGVYTSNGAGGGAGYADGGHGGGTATGSQGGLGQTYCAGPAACHPSERLFMGGGGGTNTSTARGGSGGGIIYIAANTIAGTGLFKAYGANGLTDASSGGGGGGGGSIYIKANDLGSGAWTARAKGGNGGTASFSGGGGGGGAAELLYCTTTNGSVIIDVSGGTTGGTGGTITPVAGYAGFGPSPAYEACP